MIDPLDALSRSSFRGLLQRTRRAFVVGAVLCLAQPVRAQSSTPGPTAAPGFVTLEELRAFAERHAPRAQLAQSRRLQGTAAQAEASLVLHENPTLTFAAGPRIAGDARGVDLQASLAQPIEIAGQRGLRRAAAARVAERFDAELALAGLALQRDVSLAYHAVLVTERRHQLGARLRALSEQALSVAQRRLGAGEATSIDVRVAEADAARARALELAAENELRSERLELALVTGWPADTPPLLAPDLTRTERPPTLETLLDAQRAEHPEVMARQAAMREASAEVELADRRAWPSPTFALSFAREASVGEAVNYVALGSVALALPLWSRNDGERAQTRAAQALASAEQTLALRERRARLMQAHAALVSAAARIELLEHGAGCALEDGLGLLERSLEHGESSLLELAAARERLGNAQLEALAARADYYRARAELEYLLGAAGGILARIDGSASAGGAR
jgi:cobalt-zinc-cadmium efflux system outer membrane protein